MNITIADVKALPIDKPCKQTLHVQVLDKSAVTRYTSEGSERLMATVIVGNETDTLKALVYDMDNLGMMTVNQGVQIQDFIPKKEHIVINRITNVFMSTTIEVPEEVRETLTQHLNLHTTVSASLSPKKTSVGSITGIITQVKSIERKRVRKTEEEISFKRVKIRDEEGMIPVCLWRQIAETNVSRGDCVKLNNFMVTDTFNNMKQSVPAICNKYDSATIEIIPATPELTRLLDNNSDDSDDEPAEVPASLVCGIGKVTKYLSCQNASCYRKKIKDLQCEKCRIRYSEDSAGKSVIGTINIQDKLPFTFFTQQAQQMIDQLDLSCIPSDTDFVSKLAAKLPFWAEIRTNENKLTSINIINK